MQSVALVYGEWVGKYRRCLTAVRTPALSPGLSFIGCSAGGALALSAHTLASGPAVKLN